MSHEVESMFYVGETPWHGLGTPLENPPTIREAIVKAGLDWTVSTHPLFYRIADNEDDIVHRSDYIKTPNKAVVRDTDGQYLGTVGARWTPLQNIEAFEFFQPFLDSDAVSLETAGSLRHGKHVWILAALNRSPIEIVKDDAIRQYLMLSNGHDGKVAATPMITPIRVVCANTMAAAEESEASKRLRVIHSEKVKENLEIVRETIDLVQREFVASAELYQELAKRQVSSKDLKKYVKKLFLSRRELAEFEDLEQQLDEGPEPDIMEQIQADLDAIATGDRAVTAVERLFEEGRGSDLPGVKGTWWGAYNSVAEYLSYERGNSRDVRLDSLWFGQNKNTNKKALDMAREFAFA